MQFVKGDLQFYENWNKRSQDTFNDKQIQSF